MSEDLSEFFRLLKAHSVDFVVVGSHVLAAYSRPRFTEDVDVWLKRSCENALRFAACLREFGFDLADEQALALAEGRRMIRLGAPPNRIDVLNFLGAPGAEMDFDAVAEKSIEVELMGVVVPIPSKEDFVRSKREAGRPKDLRDLAELEEFERGT